MQTKKQLGCKKLLPKIQEIVQNGAFEEWQSALSNKVAGNGSPGFHDGKVD